MQFELFSVLHAEKHIRLNTMLYVDPNRLPRILVVSPLIWDKDLR